MHEFELSDEILFDRLVDGELSADERRLLIASLDDRPGGWRRCALAFLEAQAWKQELGALASAASEWPGASVVAVERQAGRRRTIQWFALAATVLIVSTFGLALRHLSHPHQFATPGPSNIAQSDPQPAGVPAAESAPEAVTALGDALTMWTSDDAGKPQPVRVPLIDAKDVDQRLGTQFQSGMPETVRDELVRNGYQVESKHRYAPFWLDNGRPLMVPVEDTKIVPISNVVY